MNLAELAAHELGHGLARVRLAGAHSVVIRRTVRGMACTSEGGEDDDDLDPVKRAAIVAAGLAVTQLQGMPGADRGTIERQISVLIKVGDQMGDRLGDRDCDAAKLAHLFQRIGDDEATLALVVDHALTVARAVMDWAARDPASLARLGQYVERHHAAGINAVNLEAAISGDEPLDVHPVVEVDDPDIEALMAWAQI